jgi:hypothetical protein
MKVILTLIDTFDYEWTKLLNSKEYESAPVEEEEEYTPEPETNSSTETSIVRDSMANAREMAKNDRDINILTLYKVSMKPFITTSVRLPKIIWDIMGRIQWRLGCKKQLETYLDTKFRIDNIIDNIILQNKNCIVLCEGKIIILMAKHLRMSGFLEIDPSQPKFRAIYQFSKYDLSLN